MDVVIGVDGPDSELVEAFIDGTACGFEKPDGSAFEPSFSSPTLRRLLSALSLSDARDGDPRRLRDGEARALPPPVHLYSPFGLRVKTFFGEDDGVATLFVKDGSDIEIVMWLGDGGANRVGEGEPISEGGGDRAGVEGLLEKRKGSGSKVSA